MDIICLILGLYIMWKIACKTNDPAADDFIKKYVKKNKK